MSTESSDGGVVLRSWSTTSNTSATITTSTTRLDIQKLDDDNEKVRRQLHELREHGRQIRLHRLQALDALETRRVTLMEILRRMEKELNDRDVYEYGDVLAEVFGERKIFAHRAVGLEALLCQYMHQMLAKQHQLKIMKKAGLDIESHYKKHKLCNKDDYHSFEALCVQLEASRLSLEAIYDDIFASQHRILAKLNQVDSGGNMTNYSIPSPAAAATTTTNKSTTNVSTTKATVESDDDRQAQMILSTNTKADLASAIGILSSSPKRVTTAASAIRAIPTLRTSTNTPSTSTSKRSNQDGKTARERRREIEKKRLARPSGQHRSHLSPRQDNQDYGGSGSDSSDLQELEKARNRMRQLEAKAMTERQNSPTKVNT
jgi:hypothetical protein